MSLFNVDPFHRLSLDSSVQKEGESSFEHQARWTHWLGVGLGGLMALTVKWWSPMGVDDWLEHEVKVIDQWSHEHPMDQSEGWVEQIKHWTHAVGAAIQEDGRAIEQIMIHPMDHVQEVVNTLSEILGQEVVETGLEMGMIAATGWNPGWRSGVLAIVLAKGLWEVGSYLIDERERNPSHGDKEPQWDKEKERLQTRQEKNETVEHVQTLANNEGRGGSMNRMEPQWIASFSQRESSLVSLQSHHDHAETGRTGKHRETDVLDSLHDFFILECNERQMKERLHDKIKMKYKQLKIESLGQEEPQPLSTLKGKAP